MPGDLYITGDASADALLNDDFDAVMIGMLLDQQVPLEWAFKGPFTLQQRLGHLDPARIAPLAEDEFVAVCREKPAIHRFPASMGRRIRSLCAVLAEEWDGHAESLWADVKAIQQPTLLFRGENSKILSHESAEKTVAEMQNARLVVIPRATHNVHSDNPTDFARELDAFLSEVLPS